MNTFIDKKKETISRFLFSMKDNKKKKKQHFTYLNKKHEKKNTVAKSLIAYSVSLYCKMHSCEQQRRGFLLLIVDILSDLLLGKNVWRYIKLDKVTHLRQT